MFSSVLLLSTSLATIAMAVPAPTILARAPLASVTGQAAVAAWRPGVTLSPSKVTYAGDGSSANGWPSRENWTTVEDMFMANTHNIQTSCRNQNPALPNNSPREISDLQAAILQISDEAKVDARFILAIVMQESEGCVRMPSTNNGVLNPGLMQSHEGVSCQGTPQDGCSTDKIFQMIRDGTSGTQAGHGLAQCINDGQQGSVDDDATQSFFRAARQYNSGSVDQSNLNNALGATGDYVLDVANRVTGWTD